MLHGDHSVVQWFADKGFVYFPWQKIYSSTFDLLLLGLINYEIAASDLSENVLLGMCWITNDWGDHWLCGVRNNQQAWASIYIQDKKIKIKKSAIMIIRQTGFVLSKKQSTIDKFNSSSYFQARKTTQRTVACPSCASSTASSSSSSPSPSTPPSRAPESSLINSHQNFFSPAGNFWTREG